MTLVTFDSGAEIPSALFDAAADPIGIHVEGRWMFLNRAFLRLLGDPPLSSLLDTSALDLIPKDEQPLILAARDRARAGGPLELVEHSILARDGSRVRVHASVSPIDLEGQRAYLVVAREVGEHDRFVAQLARSEARFKAVVEQASEAVVVHRDNRVLYVNPATVRLLRHVDESTILGQDIYEKFIPAEDHAALRTARDRHDRGELASVSVRWVRADGSLVPMEGSRTQIMWDGAPAWLVLARDVTEELRARDEQRRAEEALRVSEARYRTLFEASPQPVMLFDVEGRFLNVNAAAVRVYGYTREEFLAMTLFELKLPEDIPKLRASLQMVKAAQQTPPPFHGLRRHRTKARRVLDVELRVHGLTIDGRAVALAVCTDVTDQRRLEEQLRQSQKMDAVGRLAGGIAHDFNNILAAILGAAEAVAHKLSRGRPVLEEVQEIRAACLRASGFTRQLLTFTRSQPPSASVFALDVVLAEFQAILSRAIGPNVEMKTTLSAPLGAIQCDRAETEQLMLNLVINARDAMPRGGVLTISTCVEELASPDAEVLGLCPGRYVKLSVTDDGTGMDEATRARIFEPFFTTKSVGRGTGLGLSMAFATMQRSGGAIACTSVVGRGTTFNVYFPRVDAARSNHRPVSVPPRVSGTSETLLLVEDQDQVRTLLTRLLQTESYQVLTAANADAALEVLQARGSEVELVLTDLVMPGMSGHALAARVRESHPHIKVVFMSGYADERLVERDERDEAGNTPFLQKPFTAEELFSTIRTALGRAQATRVP